MLTLDGPAPFGNSKPSPPLPTFWLGVHRPSWLARADVPMFVSNRQMARLKSLPRAVGSWALDSGGFTEITTYGEWRTSPEQYVKLIRRYHDEVGGLAWASQQDFMCEEKALRMTGLTIEQHQDLTVRNFLTLRGLAPELRIIPVVQGWLRPHYMRCVEKFMAAGVDLTQEPLVGVGSICRRPSTHVAGWILEDLHAAGLKLHAFGYKKSGLPASWPHVASADSMAWSKGGRYERTCGTHKSESNCLDHAMWWRGELLDRLADARDRV
ncbi:DUF7221 family queuine tRNA-ribosyltransferase-like protein [Actinacidiphila sp. ITFR-21]|uniref:deazapurine DNA modification protein DpdA family protein n=1 Tax=Actinacidiphila sp. ITFR-21 TaxID=3075199 RepID=UPI00288AE17F|nr:hypothetical protein [Streptomyces sp. ITFR-21]WNI20143.1 hypothetical protein RLT57_31895 [Streptomyces sp. ITFR-21]